MILPEGITGFFEGRRGVAPPAVDPKSFARACHATARAESGIVERFEPAGIARNYHRAILRRRDAAIAVLCNAHSPWVAFAEASEGLPLRFVEATDLASRIKDAMPCEVVSLSSLEAHPDAELLVNFRAVEREQIRYWRPQRLGDIIFNFWD
jgi:hypothetical protein